MCVALVRVIRGLLFISVGLAMTCTVRAERLPIRSFSSADGLAHDHINQIYRDSRGYLWISTDEGLSRYDGYEFINFTTRDGLPHPHVNDIVEIPGKGYWVATDAGLCWFENNRFTVHRMPGDSQSQMVNTIVQDERSLWIGTRNGLFRMTAGVIDTITPGQEVTSLRFDSQGELWISTADGAFRREKNGNTTRFLAGYINDTFEDSRGRRWILTRTAGVSVLGGRTFSSGNGMPHNDVRSMVETVDGDFWIGTVGGLVHMTETGPATSLHTYTTANGLSDNRVYKLTSDAAGNVWVGTNHAGIQRIAREGSILYGEADGLKLSEMQSFWEARDGKLVLITGNNERRTLHWFDGNRFQPVPLPLPRGASGFGWGWNQYALEDRDGRWWLPAAGGLYRYSSVGSLQQLETVPPSPVQLARESGCLIGRLYEDSRANVWISTSFEGTCANKVLVWSRQSHDVRVVDFGGAAWPREQGGVVSFAEDHSGNLWIGLANSLGVVRIRDGHAERFTASAGVPAGMINDILVDQQGRLWIASSEGGVGRIDRPDAPQPHFQTYTTTSGLSSNEIWNLAEDNAGLIYISTGQALDRMDASGPDSFSIRRFAYAEGFIKGEIRASYRDREGTLWFASAQGVARLTPRPPLRLAPIPVSITGLRLNGLPVTPSASLNVEPDLRQIEIQFAGIDPSTSGPLQYEYKLENADGTWNAPTIERRVSYAHLGPGHYRFLVRISGSSDPESIASLIFTVEPSIWQQWWFRVAVIILLASMAYAAHRLRLTRALALERLRAQIATDLHDDIGSGLSQIALISEAARTQADGHDTSIAPRLSRIGEISRELADSMSDIVWTINPKHDHLGDLIYRMRRFADELLGGSHVVFDLTVEAPAAISLDVASRREIFMIFKESLHNAVRHSECTQVRIELTAESNQIKLCVIDNGKGFDVDEKRNDHSGLENMRKRAARLRGHLTIVSERGHGTSICFSGPFSRHHYINM